MDSIKIRVWDFDDKQMIYLGEHIEIVCSGDGKFKLVLGSPFHDDYWSGNVSSYKLMLWTGLQDKNCKDIYEGDIVKLYDGRMPEEMREQIVRVTFENGCFMFGGFFPYGLEGQEVVVIGNIYETPELLKTSEGA